MIKQGDSRVSSTLRKCIFIHILTILWTKMHCNRGMDLLRGGNYCYFDTIFYLHQGTQYTRKIEILS